MRGSTVPVLQHCLLKKKMSTFGYYFLKEIFSELSFLNEHNNLYENKICTISYFWF